MAGADKPMLFAKWSFANKFVLSNSLASKICHVLFYLSINPIFFKNKQIVNCLRVVFILNLNDEVDSNQVKLSFDGNQKTMGVKMKKMVVWMNRKEFLFCFFITRYHGNFQGFVL